MISYCTVVHSDLLPDSLERAIEIGIVKFQNPLARLPDLEVHCVSMCLGPPNAAVWARYRLVADLLVNQPSDCMCYCRFDIDCDCFLMMYAFECSIWFSR